MTEQAYKAEEMISVGGIAARWKVSRQHVYNLIERGELKPAFRFGGRRGLRVPLPILKDFEAAAQIEPAV